MVIAIVLSGLKEVRDALYTGPRQIDIVGALLSVVGMGGVVLGILVWQEGGEAVGALMAIGAVALAGLAYWLVRRQPEEKPALLDPDLFRVPNFRIGITQQMLQQITLGGAMIALPIFLQMTLEYDAMQAGLSIAPLSLSMFGVAILAGRKAGTRRPSTIVQWGFGLCLAGMVAIIPIVPRADSGWALLIPLMVAGSGLGLLVSQLNNYTLAPISEERISEAAGVNSAAGSFGLSFGLAMGGGLMLAALSLAFTDMTEASDVIPPAQQAADRRVLEDDAEVMSNAQLEELLAGGARGRPRGDPPHQRRREGPRAAGRDARAGPRLRHRPVQRAPHGPPPRHRPVGVPGGRRPGVTDRDGFPDGFFDRQDPSPDPHFYDVTRLVTHIDDARHRRGGRALRRAGHRRRGARPHVVVGLALPPTARRTSPCSA